MNDKLRFAIDNTDNPKLLEILAKIAKLPDDAQENMLDLIQSGAFG